MSKFNDSYERLYEYWSYGSAIDYSVEKQLEDWITISREYTKLSKALDKASDILYELNDCHNKWSEKYSHCPFYDECQKTQDGCIASKEKWKEWLLKEDE